MFQWGPLFRLTQGRGGEVETFQWGPLFRLTQGRGGGGRNVSMGATV